MASLLNAICEILAAVIGVIWELLGLPNHRRQKITSFRFDERPHIHEPSVVRIRSKFASACEAVITDSHGLEIFNGAVSPNGSFSWVPQSLNPFMISIKLEPRTFSRELIAPTVHQWRSRGARARKLWLWARVSRSVLFGEQIIVKWHAPRAKVVKIKTDDAYNADEITEANSGKLLIYPEHMGKIIVRILAINDYTETVKSFVVNVREPMPKIIVDKTKICGRPGESVIFSWASNARENWLEAPARGETHTVKAVDQFTVSIGRRPEEFVLKGRQRSITTAVKLTTIPWYGIDSEYA
jgi:hypothetical protein